MQYMHRFIQESELGINRPWPNFIEPLNGMQIFVLTVAVKFAEVLVYFTG